MESDAQNNSRFPVMYSNDTAFLYNSVYVCVLWLAEVAIQCSTKARNHLSVFGDVYSPQECPRNKYSGLKHAQVLFCIYSWRGLTLFSCFQKVVKLTRCFQPFNYISRSIFFTLKKIRWSSLSVCSTTLVSHGEMKSCPTKFTSYWITAHVPLHEQSEKMSWTKQPDLFQG